MVALEHYLDGILTEQKHIISQNQNPSEGDVCSLCHALEYSNNDYQVNVNKRGCLAVYSLVDSAPFDDDISTLLQLKHQHMILLMTRIIELAGEQNLPQLSPLIVGLIGVVMKELNIEIKNNMAPEVANDMPDNQVQLLAI